jgi:uncharacterized YigZ family protein
MYLTLAALAEAETRVRGSRFLAIAAPAETEDEARALLERRRREMFDATHHCSAWRLRGGVWRANDGGEPSGSAGAPILAAIDGAGVEQCAVVVTRYFGGTRLGVGGLIRAYGESAALALDAAPRRAAVPALRLRIRYPYEHTSAVMRALERAGAEEVEHGFAESGSVAELTLSLPETGEPALLEMLREQTAGAVRPERLGERVLYQPL